MSLPAAAISPERRFLLDLERAVAGRARHNRLDHTSARTLLEGGPA